MQVFKDGKIIEIKDEDFLKKISEALKGVAEMRSIDIIQNGATVQPLKCTCGAVKSNATGHSSWCDTVRPPEPEKPKEDPDDYTSFFHI